MKPALEIDLYEQFGLLIQGPPKSGKTGLACCFPRPWVANADSNLAGFVRECRAQNYKSPLLATDIMRDDAGVAITDIKKVVMRFMSEISTAMKSPTIDTLILDSMSTLIQMTMQYVPVERYERTGKGEKNMMELQDWNVQQNFWKKVIMDVRSSGKMLVVLCHEEAIKDELAGGVTKWICNLPGTKLQTAFPGFFSDVWRTEIETDVKTQEPKFVVRVKPTPKLDLGGSLSFPTTTFVSPHSLAERSKLLAELVGKVPDAQASLT